MFEQLGNVLLEQESVSLSVKKKEDGKFDVIVAFQPRKIPTSVKHEQLPKKDKTEIEEKSKMLEKLRAELAKPRVLHGTPSELDEQMTELATLPEHPTYQRLNNVFEMGVDGLDELIAEAEQRFANKKNTTKKTSGCSTGSCGAKKPAKKPAAKTATASTSDTKAKSEPKKEVSAQPAAKKEEPVVDSQQFNLLDAMEG